jgi:uncharacterized membrane protein
VAASLVALPVIPGGVNTPTVVLILFCAWHAAGALGARRTGALLAVTSSMSWVLEEVGVATGLVYGPYHYTSLLGPWLGSVPLLIPLAWFVLIYPSYVAANFIVDGRLIGSPGTRVHLVALSIVGALVVTGFDLLVDPLLSGPTVRAWVWEQEGAYFGVPAQNYLGWVVTAFVIFIAYRSLERRWERQPTTEPSRSIETAPA